jgi:hypothetical protein
VSLDKNKYTSHYIAFSLQTGAFFGEYFVRTETKNPSSALEDSYSELILRQKNLTALARILAGERITVHKACAYTGHSIT